MWIDIKTNLPNDGDQVLVKMDDGTQEKECYGVAKYSGENGFKPTNLNIFVYGRHQSVSADFSYPVVAWRPVKP